ncbi:MAG: hypothetical protein Q4B48_03450 [Syntrophomonadaceae bacterium]|nr:hypothetical protein [Syntrophomonadaceae bacterium]
MFIVIKWDKKRRRMATALLALLLALSCAWWLAVPPSPVAVWREQEDEIPSGNPLRVQAPLYGEEGISRLVLKMQNFYLEP